MNYTLFSKDRLSSYSNLTKHNIQKSAFLKDYLEFQPADNYEIELNFSPETLFSIGQFLKYGFLDSMVSNYGHLIQAFDFLRINEYVKKHRCIYKKVFESPIISPEALLEFLDARIDIPENFPVEYGNELMQLLKENRKYFFVFLKLSPTNDEIQMFISRRFKQWDKIDINQFIEEFYKLYDLMRQRLATNPLVENHIIYLLNFSRNNPVEIYGLYDVGDYYENYSHDDKLFDELNIKYWEIGSKLFPMIYYYYALQIVEDLSTETDPSEMEEDERQNYNYELRNNRLLQSHAKSHIEYMKNVSKSLRTQSCISCGKMAQFKTDQKKTHFCVLEKLFKNKKVNGLEM